MCQSSAVRHRQDVFELATPVCVPPFVDILLRTICFPGVTENTVWSVFLVYFKTRYKRRGVCFTLGCFLFYLFIDWTRCFNRLLFDRYMGRFRCRIAHSSGYLPLQSKMF